LDAIVGGDHLLGRAVGVFAASASAADPLDLGDRARSLCPRRVLL
jgi:hypothetical protein